MSIEEAWIAYAHELLDDKDHQVRCANAGGSPSGVGLDPTGSLDPDLRWPGYLGRDYRAGGVLCVATVHRDFESNGAGPQVRADIVDATRRFRDRTITDTDYLESVRRGYEAGLAKWIVGGHLGTTLRTIKVPLTAIAYVNAARCQYPEDRGHLPDPAARKAAKVAGDKTKAALLKLCWKDFPVTRIIDMLRPRFVLFANAPTFFRCEPHLASTRSVAAACIHPWQGKAGLLLRPLTVGNRTYPRGTALELWAPSITAHLKDDGTN
jgi:hypothetical protein